MGPKTEPTGALYFLDGTKFCDLAEIPDFQPVLDPIDEMARGFVFPDFQSLTASISGQFVARTPKYFRCRSRKRFIKLLMSKGHDKRTATALAFVWWIAGIPYQLAWSWEAFSC